MARMEDIAAAISIFAIFSPFRVFSQSHHIAEMILYCEKLRKTQNYAKIVFHPQYGFRISFVFPGVFFLLLKHEIGLDGLNKIKRR